MKQFGKHDAKCNKRIWNAYFLLPLSCLIRSFQIDPESYPQLFQGNYETNNACVDRVDKELTEQDK